MPKTTINLIKPALGITQMTDGDFLSRLHAVHDCMLNNTAYPTPPIAMPAFKAAIDAFAAAAAAALDGGKTALAERDKCRSTAAELFRVLGHYVEAASKGDINIFLSSGFIAAKRERSSPQPTSTPAIVRIEQGSSGQLLVTIQSVKARGYELRYSPSPAAGGNFNWTTISVYSTKPATPVNNLTPGTTYVFQVRAGGKLGFSAWSAPVERMAI